MSGGRPLRFLALTLGGWILIRIAVLLSELEPPPPAADLPALAKIIVPAAAATPSSDPRPPPARMAFAGPTPIETVAIAIPHPAVLFAQPRKPLVPPQHHAALPATRSAFVTSPQVWREPPGRPDATPLLIARPFTVHGGGRLNASAWMLVRGGPAGTVSGGQLGASQAGVRITYAIDAARRFALSARLATPLKGRGREAALGVDWQLARLPIHLVAEQRFVLDGGRGGPTVGVIAGYGPSDIAPGIRIEAYGQGGAILREGLEGFIDASARVTHPLGTIGKARVDIGIGAWGSAQRAAARFDVGPSVVATLPIARKSLRLTLDWRERIAGNARPGSGPALSIGSDF